MASDAFAGALERADTEVAPYIALIDARQDGDHMTICDETEAMTHWITSDLWIPEAEWV